MCIFARTCDSFFPGVTPISNLEHWPNSNRLLIQSVSVIPLKPLNRISCIFVGQVDIGSGHRTFFYYFFSENIELWPKYTFLSNLRMCTWLFFQRCFFCMPLSFVKCSIVKQCWRMSYVSLYIFSFIVKMTGPLKNRGGFSHSFCLMK